MPNYSTLSVDEDGKIVSRTHYDNEAGTSKTIKLSDEERKAVEPDSQFNNLEAAEMLNTQSEKPEPSFLQDVQRVGLKTAFGPLELASDLVVRPFSADKEAYDKAADEWFRESKESVLTAFGEDDVSDVLDPETGKIRGTDTVAGTVVDIGSYLVGGGAVFKILNKVNQTRKLNTISKAIISEQAAEQALADPDYNLANLANDLAGENIPLLEYLAADEDDDVLLNRAKMAISSGITTGVVSGLMRYGFNGLEVKEILLWFKHKYFKTGEGVSLNERSGQVFDFILYAEQCVFYE